MLLENKMDVQFRKHSMLYEKIDIEETLTPNSIVCEVLNGIFLKDYIIIFMNISETFDKSLETSRR